MTVLKAEGMGSIGMLMIMGYASLAARCLKELNEWRGGITPSLELLLRRISRQPVIDLGALQLMNAAADAAKKSLGDVMQSGHVFALSSNAVYKLMPYVDAGIAEKPHNAATLADFCVGLAAAYFFPFSADKRLELFSMLKVAKVEVVHDLTKLQWDTDGQGRTLQIPYDLNTCITHNVVLGVRSIYEVCMLEGCAPKFEEGKIVERLQLAGERLWPNSDGMSDRLRTELAANCKTLMSAVYVAKPHFGAEAIIAESSRFSEADRKGYLVICLLDTLMAAHNAGGRAARAEIAAKPLQALNAEMQYVQGVGLAELVG